MADGDRLRVTIVEPWFTGSHRAWADGYAKASGHDVTLVTHPGAHWKWRMQGSPLTLARDLAAHEPPDVLLVSGMVHLPALLGLARRAIGDAAVVLYLHENQLTYPSAEGGDADEDLTYPLITWLSMAAADEVWCNSAFHRQQLLAALPDFLARFPGPPHGGAVPAVAERTSVMPVGLDLAPFRAFRPPAGDRPVVLWNHRWEHDKAPERFLEAVTTLAAEGAQFDLALAGQRFRTAHPALGELRRRFGDRIVHDGFVDDTDDYARLLLRSDVVVSTARHEFFGIAVLEATAAGAFPVVPDDLSYRELLPPGCRYAAGGLPDLLRRAVIERPPTDDLRRQIDRFDWSVVAPGYDERLSAAARRARSSAPRSS